MEREAGCAATRAAVLCALQGLYVRLALALSHAGAGCAGCAPGACLPLQLVTQTYVGAPGVYLGVPLVLLFFETCRCSHHMKVFRVFKLSSLGVRGRNAAEPVLNEKRGHKDFMWFYVHKRLSLSCGPVLKQWRCARAEAQLSVWFLLAMVHSMFFLLVIIPNIELSCSQLLGASPKQSLDSHSSLNVPF